MSLADLLVAVGVTGVLFICFTLFGPRRECGGNCGSCSGSCATHGDHDAH